MAEKPSFQSQALLCGRQSLHQEPKQADLIQGVARSTEGEACFYKGRVAQLRLTNFRSYQSLKLESDARQILLLGENGAGKTNILEGLSMLGLPRDFRSASLSDMLYSNAEPSG